MRFVLCVEPGSGRSVLIPAIKSLRFCRGGLQYPQQMRNLCDHSANCGSIFGFPNRIQFSQSKPLHDQLLLLSEADCAPIVLNAKFAPRRLIFLRHEPTPKPLLMPFPAVARLPADPSGSEVLQKSL